MDVIQAIINQAKGTKYRPNTAIQLLTEFLEKKKKNGRRRALILLAFQKIPCLKRQRRSLINFLL